LIQSGQDAAPPQIELNNIQDGWLTNRAQITVGGYVEDDTYVAAIAINGQKRFIELAEPRLPFEQEIDLHHGFAAYRRRASGQETGSDEYPGPYLHRKPTVKLTSGLETGSLPPEGDTPFFVSTHPPVDLVRKLVGSCRVATSSKTRPACIQ